MTTPFGKVIEDFDFAFSQLVAAKMDSDEQRRSFDHALDRLYEIRAYREGETGSAKGKYRTFAQGATGGRTTEGIVFLRGQKVHNIARAVRPEERDAYPSDTFFPSNWTYPGANLTWLSESELAEPLNRKANPTGGSYYDNDVAGHLVLPTLDIARNWLVHDTDLFPAL